MEIATDELLKAVITVLLTVVLWLLWSHSRQRDPTSTEQEECDQVSNTTTEEDLERLKSKLKNTYRVMKANSLTLMTTNITYDFIDLILSTPTDKSTQKTKEDIFLPVLQEIAPSKILIEGNIGCGKSSLVHRLAYDWAVNEPYIRHFDIVLVVPIHNLQVNSLTDVLFTTAGVSEKKDMEHLYNILEDPSKHSLIMLDGFCQITPELLFLIRGDVLQHVTVVMTIRSDKLLLCEEGYETYFMNEVCTAQSIFNLFDKRITIECMTSDQQKALVTNILSKVSVPLAQTVKYKLEELVSFEFCQSPMFLSMSVAIFLGKIENIKTKVDFYKHLFTYAVQRYSNELGVSSTISSLEGTEIAASDAADRSLCAAMTNQLGQISYSALIHNECYYTPEKLTELNIDCRISDLGFVNLCVAIDGFQQQIRYKPIHNSIFEFAAAYSLWFSYSAKPLDVWQQEVCCLRPSRDSSEGSFVYPVLANLLEENVSALFQALQMYDLEYHIWFYSLMPTLIETQITPATIAAVTQLLPVEWQVPAWDVFTRSPWHGSLIKWGVNNDTIKLLTWKTKHITHLPYAVCVETVALRVEVPIVKCEGPIDEPFKHRLTCKNLWCYCENLKSCLDWQSFLTLLKAINFQQIAFHFTLDSPFSYFHTAFVMGPFRDVKIDRLKVCMDVEKQGLCLALLVDILHRDKVRGLHIVFSSGIVPTTSCSFTSFLSGEHCVGEEFNRAYQEQINKLVQCAGKSTYLTSFAFSNVPQRKNLIINLSLLCEQSEKSWELIKLQNVTLKCETDTKQTINRIQCLDITDTDILVPAVTLFCNIHVTSFVCNSALLFGTTDLDQIFNDTSELELHLDNCILDQALVYSIAVQIQHLQVLSLALTSELSLSFSFLFVELLFGPYSYLRLKGLEIWRADLNPLICIDLVEAVINFLQGITCASEVSKEGSAETIPSTCEPKRMQLEYLLLSTDLNLDVDDLSTISVEDKESLLRFISVTQLLKPILTKKLLQTLFITCFETLSHYMLKMKLSRIGSWNDVFSHDEGFRVRHDLCGMAPDDSYKNKTKYVTEFGLYKRFSVTTQ